MQYIKRPIETKKCVTCGKEFKTSYSRKKYCGKCPPQPCKKCGKPIRQERWSYFTFRTTCKSCWKKTLGERNKGRKKECVCKVCKKTFVAYPNSKFCSLECRSLVHHETSNLIASCSACGKETFLVIHHKDFDSKNNDPDNKEYICKSCHNLRHIVHKNKVPYWQRKDILKSLNHFNNRYKKAGGLNKLRDLLTGEWGCYNKAAQHFGVSRELVRQWRNIYKDYL